MNCICCNRELVGEYISSDPENGCWAGAVVCTLQANFGSRFDTDRIVVGICDDCIVERNLVVIEGPLSRTPGKRQLAQEIPPPPTK